jgi:hypothetical protein
MYEIFESKKTKKKRSRSKKVQQLGHGHGHGHGSVLHICMSVIKYKICKIRIDPLENMIRRWSFSTKVVT